MAAPMGTCTFSTKKGFEGVLASFPNGKLKSDSLDDIRFGYFRSKDPHQATKRTLVAETDRMTYTGERRTGSRDLMKYYVGVLDKKTGKMQVVDAKLFNMKTEIPGAEDSEDEVDAQTNQDMTFMEKNDMLTTAFGSSKKKKSMESRLRNKIKEDTLDMAVGAAVAHALSQPSITATTPTKSHDAASAIIPPYNKDAERPQDVYKLEDIINSQTFEALHHVANVFTEATKEDIQQWTKDETYASYILNHLSFLPIQEEARMKKAKCLLYMNYLIKLYRLKATDFKRKEPLDDSIPEPIKKTLYDNFTIKAVSSSSRSQKCMPARLKDKCASYILTLGLIIDEFNMDLSMLCKDLKMTQTRLTTFLRALGCRVSGQKAAAGSSRSDIKFATLPIPLIFPQIHAKKDKERR